MAGILSGGGTTNCGKEDIYNYWIRVSEHLPWIKCVQRNANENETTRDIERACNQFIKQFNRKCEKDENGNDIQNSCKQCERFGLEEEVCVPENFF